MNSLQNSKTENVTKKMAPSISVNDYFQLKKVKTRKGPWANVVFLASYNYLELRLAYLFFALLRLLHEGLIVLYFPSAVDLR